MDKNRRVSIETISGRFDVSVGTVHTVIRVELKMRKICVVCPKGAQRRSVLDALVTCDESLIYCYDADTTRLSSQWKHADSPRPKKARQNKSTHKLFMIPFCDSTGMIYMHWVPTGQTVNKEYYVEVLREFR